MQEKVEQLEEQIRLARDGDLAAYGRVVRRFQQTAYSLCYAILGDFHLAEDAAQEAFIEAHARLATLRHPHAFASWFRRILIKQCDRITRQPAYRVRAVAREELPDAAVPAAADCAVQAEIHGALLKAVRRLPEHERLVTTLFYMDGYSLSDIAHFLEVPEGTVKSRLNSSRKKLKESVGTMVEQALRSNPLPERFADVVVEARMVEDRIIPLSERLRSLSDAELLERHQQLKGRFVAAGREAGVVEAMAVAREAIRRATGLELYPSQLIAALFLERGWIAEMPSGEGKALTIVPAAYAMAVQGKTVDVLTPNDYLAQRDATLATSALARLGVKVGWIGAQHTCSEREAAHSCQIMYATATDAAMSHLGGSLPQRDAAIVDEADSILIDDAPTIVALAGEQTSPELRQPVEQREGEDYFIADGRVLPIDPVYSRCVSGRVFADGVQQMLEQRHGLELTPAYCLSTSTTIGDFMHGYAQLSGLTGTALVRRDLLARSYRLEAVVVPTHRDLRLVEQPDRIYASDAARCEAAVAEVVAMTAERRAVLLACPSVSVCRRMSALLQSRGIEHGRLDGSPETMAYESDVIGRAGQPGAVTVATAVAGRGADISVSAEAGGLHVVGVGRHASRRVDLQFVRRAARQGQRGSCRFVLAADDAAVKQLGLMVGSCQFIEDPSLMGPIAQAQLRLEDQILATRLRQLVVRV